MNLEEKQSFVANLKEDLASANILLVAHYAGLSVLQMNELRSEAKKNAVTIRVAKNSLVRLAIKDTEFADITEDLAGPTVLIFADDIVAAAKILVKFAKDNEELDVKFGSYNKSKIGNAEIVNISKMPSLDEIRAKLISLIQTPASKIVGVLQAPASQNVGVLKAYSEK